MIPTVVVGKLASQVFDALAPPASTTPAPAFSPLSQAHDRLARAYAAGKSIEAYEAHAVPIAMLAGAAVSIARRR